MEDIVDEKEVAAKTAPLEGKKDSVDEFVLHTTVPSCLWPYESLGAVCAPSKQFLVEGTVTTLAGRTEIGLTRARYRGRKISVVRAAKRRRS